MDERTTLGDRVNAASCSAAGCLQSKEGLEELVELGVGDAGTTVGDKAQVATGRP